MNSRRCNLRTQRGWNPLNPARVDFGGCPAPPGPQVLGALTSVGFTYGYSRCCPPGNSFRFLDLTYPYARMSETFQAKPETPTSVSRTAIVRPD